jgi:anti-sigma B factor antagonist
LGNVGTDDVLERQRALGDNRTSGSSARGMAYGCRSDGDEISTMCPVCNSMSKLTYEVYGDALIATFDGSITRRNAATYQEDLAAAIEPARHVILDFSEVDEVSGSGFRMMLHVYHLACMRGGTTTLVGLNDELQYTVEATGFGEFFLVCQTLDEALCQVRNEQAGFASVR